MKFIGIITLVALTLITQVRAGFVFPFSGCLTSQGWKEFNGHCYKLMYDRLTAEPSDVATMRDTCQNVGPIKFGDSGAYIGLAYLADIQSMEENDFVSEMVAGGSRAWIGAEKDVSSFYWIRDSESDKVAISFTNWKFNEPNDKDGSEDCVETNRGPPGKWNDLLCSRKLPGVCKYNIAAYTASRTD